MKMTIGQMRQQAIYVTAHDDKIFSTATVEADDDPEGHDRL